MYTYIRTYMYLPIRIFENIQVKKKEGYLSNP